jgi:transcriptional regulator with XRE-family HTH domain
VDFPSTLRERRTRRHLSQLDLALRAGTTQRHLSFIENGRSAPGRNLILRLAESMQLPLRERNELLLAAGYAPAYPETRLDAPGFAHVRTALDGILAGHEPYPAIIVDRMGDLVAANQAFDLLTEGAAAHLLGTGRNVYRLALHPEGMARRIVNLAQWARHILDRLDQAPDGRFDELHAELGDYVPDALPDGDYLGFAVPLQIKTSLGVLHLMTTVTTFATAVDVTLSELKLEAFLPADQDTHAVLHRA